MVVLKNISIILFYIFILGQVQASEPKAKVDVQVEGDKSKKENLQTAITDGDADEVVNLRDFAIFSAAWQTSKDGNNWNPNCDISEPGDDVIDQMDFMQFVANW